MNKIHPTAIIHPTVKIGVGNYIGPYTIIEENVIIGDNNYIGPHCIIGDIGESVNYFDTERKGVEIGNNNRFTKQVTIDSGTISPTKIHNNTLWLKNAHAGHDVEAYDFIQVRCNGIVGGHVTLNEYSKVYLSAIVHPRLNIPKKTIIGMGSVVVKKTTLIEDGVYIGNPARLLRINN
jgi:UDP-N-acetylglucosamine acyltransferase